MDCILTTRYCIASVNSVVKLLGSLTYLDLDPPTPAGALGDETFPPTSVTIATLRTPLQLTRILCKSSWNVCHQVFVGHPFLLLPPSGIHCIATFDGLSGGSRSIYTASVSLLTLTILIKSSIPALLINSSLVMWSRKEMPNTVRKHLRWKMSNIM